MVLSFFFLNWFCQGFPNIIIFQRPNFGFLETHAPFTPQGETESWVFPLNCRVLCWVWGLWLDCVSVFPTPFLVGILSLVHCEGFTQLVYGINSEGIDLCVAVYLVCLWEKGNWAASYVTIFVFVLLFFYF